jgi:hypothetical protein
LCGTVLRPSHALLLVPLAIQACGPSVSTIYEGNIRFEHCYRLDLDPNIAPTHRLACWKEWTERYTYGQTRDRLEYARRRMKRLGAGDQSRPVLKMDMDASAPAEPPAPDEAPVPTSLHKPPPPTSKTAAPPASADAGPEASGPPPPNAECTKECQVNWDSCEGECRGDAGKPKSQCAHCKRDYPSCMKRCFK